MSIVRIGTAGWNVPKQYAGEFPGAGSHLERYSQVLCCVEINSSFYHSHRISTWAKWAESVPDDFRFSVKAPRAITHKAQLDCGPELLRIFLAEVTTLAGKLGPILFQLPPKSPFRRDIAHAFLEMLRELHQGLVVFEPRHPSWFSAEANQLLQEFHVARAVADPAPVPEAASPAGWDGLVYYRLHGSPRMYYSVYSEIFLRKLAADIERQRHTGEIWCVFDNTAVGAALGDARVISGLIRSETCGEDE